MLVVGEKEQSGGTVAVRQHRRGDQGTVKPEEFKARVLEAITNKSLTV